MPVQISRRLGHKDVKNVCQACQAHMQKVTHTEMSALSKGTKVITQQQIR